MQEQKIGIYDAKNHLSQIIQQIVESGQGITITINGQAKVDVIPAVASGRLTRDEAIRRILNGPPALPGLTRDDIRAGIEEGRR